MDRTALRVTSVREDGQAVRDLAHWMSRPPEERVAAVGNFYNAVDAVSTNEFLKKYDVRYIVVGQLERAAYTPVGIAKFEQFDGKYWQEVYRDGNTAVYEVSE